jgi:ribosomal protein L16 Arg81 hydroxylase
MAAQLLESTSLEVGDLVYLPRGVMHRGIGGVLAQVITVPGFIPGSEIGVDHHLKAINQNLNLSDKQALPYHSDAANGPVIK